MPVTGCVQRLWVGCVVDTYSAFRPRTVYLYAGYKMGYCRTSVGTIMQDGYEYSGQLTATCFGRLMKGFLPFGGFYFFLWRCAPTRAMATSFMRFLDHTQRHTTVGRAHLDEWSARRRDLYLTTHNTNNRQTSMPPAGFEPATPASERPQTHALDRAATKLGGL